jgi:phage baseplate assembly protein W
VAAEFLGVGWRFPVSYDEAAGALQRAAYEESVREAILIILRTARGERVMRPDFGCGLEELVFAVNDSATLGLAEFEVREALRQWEPRIEILDVTATVMGPHASGIRISIDYLVRTTDNRFNLVYPFYLRRELP